MIAIALAAIIFATVPIVVGFVFGMLLDDDTYYASGRSVTKSWVVGASPKVEVKLFEGYITVVQSTDGRVSATLSPFAVTKASQAAADLALDDIAIVATQEGDTIRIATTNAPRFPMSQLKADIELCIPPGARLDLVTGHGYIYIGKAWRGPHGAYLTSSPVALRSARARDLGDTYTGIHAEIAFREGSPPTELDLVSLNGSVEIKGKNVVTVKAGP